MKQWLILHRYPDRICAINTNNGIRSTRPGVSRYAVSNWSITRSLFALRLKTCVTNPFYSEN